MTLFATRWQRLELRFTSTVRYDNPVQDVTLHAHFTAPSGREYTVPGFWDGDNVWRVRFAPDEEDWWQYTTFCSDPDNGGLHDHQGAFECNEGEGLTAFENHGPVRLAANRRYLAHADGKPFFWLGDTGWYGSLLATDEEWTYYCWTRARQGYTAVQIQTTQWAALPNGDRLGEHAFTGNERIVINPAFFQRLDQRLDTLNRFGLLAVPVLLWTAVWMDPAMNRLNPGNSLPEDQAIVLANYMVARWQAHDVAWILNGDGRYEGGVAARWRRIGQAVFGEVPHAPVTMHPCGTHWPYADFQEEAWLDIVGYQSGHSSSAEALRWITSGPPATDWRKMPARPFINLEPPYENHMAFPSSERFGPQAVRRAIYWSLLNAPTAGVTYGGHGVWGWDDGSAPPLGHPKTGIPYPWQDALHMAAGEQMAHLAKLMRTIRWHELRPAPELVTVQPGDQEPRRYIAAAQSADRSLALFYIPEDDQVTLDLSGWRVRPTAEWFNPRNGERQPAFGSTQQFITPTPGDWVLLLQTK